MTEDMRERFEKAREDFAASYNDMHSRCVARAAFMAGWQEAALSSAGTSGTDALVDNILDVAYDSLLTHSQRKTNITALLWGDSLSGKGEATKEGKFVSTDERQIKHMVERFLQWKLPENFNPDGGISFKKMFNEHTDHPMKHEPVGTNLFDYTQAEQMVRYIVDGLPSASAPDRAEELAREILKMLISAEASRSQINVDRVASLLRREMWRSSGQEGRDGK